MDNMYKFKAIDRVNILFINTFLVYLHGDYQSKYNFVETPRDFFMAKLSIGKLSSSLFVSYCGIKICFLLLSM